MPPSWGLTARHDYQRRYRRNLWRQEFLRRHSLRWTTLDVGVLDQIAPYVLILWPEA